MAWNLTVPDAEYYTLASPELDGLAREVYDQPVIAIDTETNGLDIIRCQPYYWSISWDNAGVERRITMPTETMPAFRRSFRDYNKSWVFANAKFDVHMCANIDVDIRGNLIDTAVMHALLYDEDPHGLKEMAWHKLGWKWTDFQDTFGKVRKGVCICGATQAAHEKKVGYCKKTGCGRFTQMTSLDVLQRAEQTNMNKLVDYAANDAYATWKLYKVLDKELGETNIQSFYDDKWPHIVTMRDYYYRTEMPFTRVLFTCERNGLRVDRQRLEDISPGIVKDLENLRFEINSIVGRVLKPNSSADLIQYFRDEQGIKPHKMTKGGKSGIRKPSIDGKFLEYVRDYKSGTKAGKVAELLLEHSAVAKQYSTYIQKMPARLDENDRVHPKLNQDVARTGRLTSSDPNCFHPDTELLTPTGWQRITEVTMATAVAQWDAGVIRFVLPTALQRQHADRLVRLANEHTSLLLTEDHRCLLRHRRSQELRVFPAMDYKEDWQQLHAGIGHGGTWQPSTPLLQLAVATQADGSISHSGVVFGLRKNRKIERLQRLLRAAHLPYSHHVNTTGTTIIRIPKEAAAPLLCMLTQRKTFDFRYLQLTPDLRAVFCEEVFHWDDCFTRKNHYSSDHRINAEVVQALLTLNNCRAHLRPYMKPNGALNWQVDVVHRDYSCTTNIHKDLIDYGGDVYCLSVPSGYVLVRHADKICVTGQCQNVTSGEKDRFHLREAFIASDGNEMVVADYCVSPATRILTAGLYWKTADHIKVGEDLIGFDEELGPASTYVHSYVQAKKELRKECIEIGMSDGSCLTVSTDHHWVVGGGGHSWKRRNRAWVRSDELELGDQIAHFCQPWQTEESRDAGYLSGILDGEGWVALSGKVGFAQKPNACLAECERILADLPLHFSRRSRPYDAVQSVEFYGPKEGLRVLGMLRPPRLLQKSDVLWVGKRTWSSNTDRIFVTSLRHVGIQPVVALQTSSKTFIAEGFLSHNCQLEMRLLAAAANEPAMIDIFHKNWDIHMGNASLVFDIPYDDIVAAKKIDKEVKAGKLPASAMTKAVLQCLKARGDAKTIGFG